MNNYEKKKIEQLNVFKLIEAPYMSGLLLEENYEEFMKELKQSEVEMANKIRELIDTVNGMQEYLSIPEHKEKITLSEAERIILENIDKKYKWIARDYMFDELYVFSDKPVLSEEKNWENKDYYLNLSVFRHLFQFITWNDSEPYNIAELLEGNK